MDERPLLQHLPAEFLTWLWFASIRDGGNMNLGGEIGWIDVWVDDRIAFRAAGDDKPRAVMTGENTAEAIEALAALAGGRLVKELRICIRREDREFALTLKNPTLDLTQVKLPGAVSGDEAIYDRMGLYEELTFIVAGLLRKFAGERTAESWDEATLPAMRAWVRDGVGG
ncbi:MAG: hypothetical protein GY913_08915 [Proteobacteria bacterium]|nr:hypothetical protein [Pseudomonadota bacterium]MCP4917031.1 hypothetical protein [Pseudomonadota bacterium]